MARKKPEPAPVGADRLRSIVERLERLNEEIRALKVDCADILKEAKAAGFDKKVILQMLRERAMDPVQRQDFETLCELYRAALGMLNGTPLGEAARRRFEQVANPPEDEDAEPVPGGSPPPPAPKPGSTPDDMLAAKAQGAAAAKAGRKVTDNPFGSEDARRAAWDEGWCAATGSDGMEIPAAFKRTPGARKPRKGDDKKGGAA